MRLGKTTTCGPKALKFKPWLPFHTPFLPPTQQPQPFLSTWIRDPTIKATTIHHQKTPFRSITVGFSNVAIVTPPRTLVQSSDGFWCGWFFRFPPLHPSQVPRWGAISCVIQQQSFYSCEACCTSSQSVVASSELTLSSLARFPLVWPSAKLPIHYPISERPCACDTPICPLTSQPLLLSVANST